MQEAGVATSWEDRSGEGKPVCGGEGGGKMTNALYEEIDRLRKEKKDLLEVCRLAFEWSCRKSETNRKWTGTDQYIHDHLKEAINKHGEQNDP